MISVNKETGREDRRPVAVVTLLAGLILTLMLSAVMPNLASAGPTEYPVRFCSPAYVGQGTGTHNGGIGPATVFHKAANGSMSYGSVGSAGGGWNIWNPILRCDANNPIDANGVANYGMRFFDENNGIVSKGEEGGLEWTIPGDLKLRQVGMKGRALVSKDPGSTQGGLGSGGIFLKQDFVGGQAKEWDPATGFSTLSGFSADSVQNTNTFRLGLICDPSNGASVCFGARGEQALISDLQFVMTDPNPPSLSVGSSPIANGEWVSGNQSVTFTAQDTGSGLRETSVFVDDNEVSEKTIPGCDLVEGTFATGADTLMQARNFRPCPLTPQTDTVNIDTTRFGDGAHKLKVCARDFAGASRMWNGDQKAAWTCSSPKDIFIDNTAPSAPETAEAINPRIPRSVNPNDVTWTNPGTTDNGSPIHEVSYQVVNQAGNVVVPTQTVDNGSDSHDAANSATAGNIIHIPTLDTPDGQGEYTIQMRLEDSVGHVGKVAEVPLSYACGDSGGTPLPQADIAMGLIEPKQPVELATPSLDLDQGDPSTVVGKVRGPGQMPINGADVCIDAKPVVDPQLQLLTTVDTNGNGNFTSPLAAGPSRNLLTVFRQGHREVWSDPVSTDVTVAPTLSTTLKGGAVAYKKTETKATVRTGKKLWFKGQIPGPYADKVVVVLQGKAAGTKAWRAFRRYRTRANGKYKVPNRFFNTSTTGKKAHLIIRTQVRYTVGYPYSQGNSKLLKLTVLPKKKKK